MPESLCSLDDRNGRLVHLLNVSPRSGYLIVSNNGNGTVGTHSIDAQTGALAQLAGSPVGARGGTAGTYTISFAP
jgi:hypothetical protein